MKDTRQVVTINLDDILPNRFQPRIKFDEKAIVELSESIKEHGVIQPIIVRRISDKYEIIAGERRYKASVMAGKTNIPAIVVDLDDKDSSEIALIENVQRQDLTPIEEAISYRKVLDMGYLTQEELATKLGVAQSTVANKLRLLNLADEVQDALLDEKISERHARSLLKLEKESMQREMLKRIINERLTVRKTDEEIEKMINNKDNNVTSFDSIENNMNIEQNNFNQNPSNTFNSNMSNPFIIDNEVNYNNNINEEPVNIKPENIEVLDFNDFMSENNVVEPNPEANFNIPSMPIIEDVPVNEVKQEEPSFNIPSIEEQNNDAQNPLNSFGLNNNIEEQPIKNIVEEEPSSNIPNEPFNPINNEENSMETDSEELRPGRFFNILNTDDDADENNESNGNMQQENSFNDMQMNPSTTNIFGQPFEKQEETNTESWQPINNEINNFDYSVPPVTPVYENEPKEQPIINNETEKMSLRDAINMVRDCANNLEKNNMKLDVEEFDFDDMYQIIIKIQK